MPADNQQITLSFVHPTDSSQVLTAPVGQASTPHYLIEQMIRSDFLTKAAAGADYKLVDTATNKELPDHTTLAASGVAPNATLAVLHSVTGALPGAGFR